MGGRSVQALDEPGHARALGGVADLHPLPAPEDLRAEAVAEPAGFHVPERPARTFPAWAPVRALDAIYARGDLRVHHLYRSHLSEARFASDHLPLYAELELL